MVMDSLSGRRAGFRERSTCSSARMAPFDPALSTLDLQRCHRYFFLPIVDRLGSGTRVFHRRLWGFRTILTYMVFGLRRRRTGGGSPLSRAQVISGSRPRRGSAGLEPASGSHKSSIETVLGRTTSWSRTLVTHQLSTHIAPPSQDPHIPPRMLQIFTDGPVVPQQSVQIGALAPRQLQIKRPA